MAKNEQIFNDTRELDNVRRELDAKINDKISKSTFYWILGVFISITMPTIGFLYWSNLDLTHRLAVIETKFLEKNRK